MNSPDHLSALAAELKDIDPAKFPHGLEQYARFGPRTVRAIIGIRDVIMHTLHLSETKFRVGLTSDPAAREAAEKGAGCVGFQVVAEAEGPDEARAIEADARLNFLWHFPGRCLNKGDYRVEALVPGGKAFVYVVCFPAEKFGILGKV